MKISTKTIRALNPCQSRLDNYLIHYENFAGTISQFLRLKHITDQDKVWVVCRIAPREIIEIFAIDCAFSSYQWYLKYAADAAADADYAAYAAADAYAYAAAYAAADAAAAAADADAAAYAAAYADAAAYAASKERANQIQALIYLCKGL